MPTPHSLVELQQWMLVAIAAPGQGQSAECWIAEGPQQSPCERLQVYQFAYVARLTECLQATFPVLAKTLGDKFDYFAAEYLERYPPASYSLNHLADHFVEYLIETRPAVPSPGWPDFLIELAQLEDAIQHVFDGPGIEDLPALDMSTITVRSADELFQLRLIAAPCLRLFAFQFPLNDFYTAVKQGAAPAIPVALPSYLAITRRDYIVRRVPLVAVEFSVLSGLASGKTLGEVLAETSAQPAEISQWFADWARLGLFIGHQ